ncbi:MAG: T9SS type A sorting domain-containing protein [Dysgonomonas sp.]
MMKILYKILLFVVCSLFALSYTNAQNGNLTLGGGAGELAINYLSTGSFSILRNGEKQVYGNEPLFGIRIGNTNYTSGSLSRGGDISVNRGTIQERTKVFSGTHNGSAFSLTVKMVYNKSNPNYLTIEAVIDASNIKTSEVMSYGYGFDTYVNGCDKAAAFILPNVSNYNGSSNSNIRFSETVIKTLRIVGAKNNSQGTESTLIGLFPIGLPFNRAYSSYYYGYKADNVINPNTGTNGTNGNRFSFAAYNSFQCPSSGGGDPWDNGIAGVYDNIPVNSKTTIRTGLTFTEDLDGELDYFWNGSKSLVANLGDNINLNLKYTSYNPNAITGVGFRVDLPGLKVRAGGSYTGFSSGSFNYTAGNEYFQLTNGGIAGLAVGNIIVPVQITQCGQWSIDADATSNMLRALPLGAPAVLTVKSTVGLSSTTAVNICKGKNHTYTIKLPDGVTAAQDFDVNLTYTGATGSFAALPTSVNIPANQNGATFTITSLATAADNATLNINLASANKEFITIGAAKTTTLKVYPSLVAGAIGGNQTICYNTKPTTISGAVSTGGDGNYAYQWQSSTNGTTGWTNITTNGTLATYSPGVLTSTTYYRRVTTNTCETAYSTVTTIIVRPELKPGTITGAQTICYNGGPVTLGSTVVGSGGDGNIKYQWQSSTNGSTWVNINGANLATYTTPQLTATTHYRREVKDGASCETVYSTSVVVTVRPELKPGTITGAQTICYNGGPVTLGSTVVGSGGDGNIKYQWQSSTNGSTWVNINGANLATYTTPQLTATTHYRREVKDGASCGTVYSTSVVVTVRPKLEAGAVGSNQTICYNSKPSALTNTTAGSGGDGNIKYQWQSSVNGTTGWTNITINGTSATYQPGDLTSTTYYRREVKDGASCGTEYSNILEIKVHPQVIQGTIKGNPFVCQGIIPLPIIGDVSTGGSSTANIKYQWQSSANGTTGWTDISGATGKDYTATSSLASNTYFRRVTTDDFCNTFKHYSNVFEIKVVSLPTTLYWKTSADTDNNWNNPNNWVDGTGIQLGMVPLVCTDVVIRGGAVKYPSLDASTITTIYGVPVCRNITFEYGSEVAYQHKLAYEKAFVQYNWGYYTGTPGNNSQPNNNGSGTTCSMNKRDIWYALAAPLKNMASGDFSFGGYPITWQGGFNIPDPVTGGTVGVDAGDFSKVYARNDINLAETNNAIAIKIPTFKTGKVGCDDQCHMNGVKGVLEFPYFENELKAQFYPTHSYDKYSLESKFFYFDTNTLQLIYSPVGKMKRGEESYRFVYENASNTAGKINLNGTEVLGYEQSVSKQLASSQKVMVGNPFMASINSKRFLDANNINPASPKIKENEGYYIFNSTTQTWENKPFSATNNIKPQQAFLVTLSDGINTTKLMYPLEGTYALTGPTFRGLSMVLPEGSSLYLKASSGVEKAGDYSILNISDPEEQYNIRKMIYTEGHVVPETFFIAADGKDFNLIQAYESGVREVGIGVKCSDTEGMISFTFENANEFYSATGACPVLIDKVTNVRQNLTKDKTYYFKQRAVEEKDKYIDAERFVLRLASPVEIMNSENSDISIVYHQAILDISATDVIKDVNVYDLQGRLVHSNNKVGAISYSKSLNLPQGVYVVKVQTENGKSKVERIMAL